MIQRNPNIVRLETLVGVSHRSVYE